MAMLPIAAVAAIALNSVLVVGMANFVTERNRNRVAQGEQVASEGSEAVTGM